MSAKTCTRCGNTISIDDHGGGRLTVHLEEETINETLCGTCMTLLGDFMDGVR